MKNYENIKTKIFPQHNFTYKHTNQEREKIFKVFPDLSEMPFKTVDPLKLK